MLIGRVASSRHSPSGIHNNSFNLALVCNIKVDLKYPHKEFDRRWPGIGSYFLKIDELVYCISNKQYNNQHSNVLVVILHPCTNLFLNGLVESLNTTICCWPMRWSSHHSVFWPQLTYLHYNIINGFELKFGNVSKTPTIMSGVNSSSW